MLYPACSRCLKPFPTEAFGEKPDCSGTDRCNWPLHTIDNHRKHALSYKSAITHAQQKEIERGHGCRYSILLIIMS